MASANYPLRENLIRNIQTWTLKLNYSIVCADKLLIDSIRLHETTRMYLFDAKIRQGEKKCIVRYIQSETNLFMFFFIAYDDYSLRNR